VGAGGGSEAWIDAGGALRVGPLVAAPLGLDPLAAASGIVEIANAHMIGAMRLVSVQRGYDPRDFVLVAFGGAGPLHANALARELIRSA
jgi:N-methylhydantoinase A